MKVAVLGSGNGGCAVAYDWAAAGHDVYLFDFDKFPTNTEAVAKNGGIYVEGEFEGFAKVAYAGSEIDKVLTDAELIFVVGPAYSTQPFGELCKPYVKKGQKYVVCPSSCGGSVVFKNALGLDLLDEDVIVAETSTLPYAVRLMEPGRIHIYLKLKDGVFTAALPSKFNKDILDLLRPVYPCFIEAKNVMQTTLQNANPVIHPVVTVFNAGLVERTKGGFLFYEEGVTSAIGNVLEAVDAERIAIGKALGIEILRDPDLGMKQGYMLENNYSTGYSKAPGFKGIMAQSDLGNRYLTEDVGYGLIFMSELGKQVGVPTPHMDALIQLASTLLKRDFRAEKARTMEGIGLGKYSKEQLKTAL